MVACALDIHITEVASDGVAHLLNDPFHVWLHGFARHLYYWSGIVGRTTLNSHHHLRVHVHEHVGASIYRTWRHILTAVDFHQSLSVLLILGLISAIPVGRDEHWIASVRAIAIEISIAVE